MTAVLLQLLYTIIAVAIMGVGFIGLYFFARWFFDYKG